MCYCGTLFPSRRILSRVIDYRDTWRQNSLCECRLISSLHEPHWIHLGVKVRKHKLCLGKSHLSYEIIDDRFEKHLKCDLLLFPVVQRRQMSSVPGGSGENIVYALLCGGAFVGAVSYVSCTASISLSLQVQHIRCALLTNGNKWNPSNNPLLPLLFNHLMILTYSMQGQQHCCILNKGLSYFKVKNQANFDIIVT